MVVVAGAVGELKHGINVTAAVGQSGTPITTVVFAAAGPTRAALAAMVAARARIRRIRLPSSWAQPYGPRITPTTMHVSQIGATLRIIRS